MNAKRSIVIFLTLAFPLLAKAQVFTNEAVVLERVPSADDLLRSPVPTNVVTLLAVRTQEVNGVKMVLKMVAQPAERISGGAMKDYRLFYRLIECQAIPSENNSNLLVYGWFLRMMETYHVSSFGLVTKGAIKGDLALTEGGNQMMVLYYELPLVGEREMWMQCYSATEATAVRPIFPDKWSHSSTNKPCVIDKEIQMALGGVLAAEIEEATEYRVRVKAEGKFTKGTKRKLEFYPQERRWVLLPEEQPTPATSDK